MSSHRVAIRDRYILRIITNMFLNVFASKINDDFMKLVQGSDIEHLNRVRISFLLKNNISSSDVALVQVKYKGDNY
jgi:hypothetical protein